MNRLHKSLLFFSLACLISAMPLQAASVFWQGTGPTPTDFNDNANWSAALTTADIAVVNKTTGPATITASDIVSPLAGLYVGNYTNISPTNTNGIGLLKMTGGTISMSASSGLRVGYDAHASATIDGESKFEMTGGTISSGSGGVMVGSGSSTIGGGYGALTIQNGIIISTGPIYVGRYGNSTGNNIGTLTMGTLGAAADGGQLTTTGAMNMGGALSPATTATAIVTLNSNALLQSGGTTTLGSVVSGFCTITMYDSARFISGSSSTSTTLNNGGGGTTVTMHSSSYFEAVGQLFIGAFNSTNTDFTLNGGATLKADNIVHIGNGSTGSSQNTLSLNDQAIVDASAFGIDMGNGSATGLRSIIDLNGGTLSTPFIKGYATGATQAINLNGGVLKAAAASTDFIQGTAGVLNVFVQQNGAVIDTNGNAVTIAQELQHGGIVTDGGLIKQGSGKLTLTGALSYTGNTVIEAGTLQIDTPGTVNLSTITGPGTLGVGSGTTLKASLISVGTLVIGAEVPGAAMAVPEPGMLMLLALATLAYAGGYIVRK